MPFSIRSAQSLSLAHLFVALCMAAAQPPLFAGGVALKNGLQIEGQPVAVAGLTEKLVRQTGGPVKTYPVVMVDTGMKRYFIYYRQVLGVDKSVELSRHETFELKQPKRSRKRMFDVIGGGANVGDFDEFGRRIVKLQTPHGPVDVVQGITEISARHAKVEGITHDWDFAVSLDSIPPETLDQIIRRTIDPSDPDDRMSLVRFYLQADRYPRAFAEIDSISADFPELESRVDELVLQLRKLYAQRLLYEVQQRRKAGQHRLAFAATRNFPTERMSEAVLRDVRKLAEEYDQALRNGNKIKMFLGDLQAKLENPELVEEVMPLRSVVSDQLDYESLDRMQAFLQFADDESLAPDEKLALAYSGWILGGAHAVTDIRLTLRLWEARFHVREYLRTSDGLRQQELLEKLEGFEGFDATRLAQMIPLLPPLVDTIDIHPGQVGRIELPSDNIPANGENTLQQPGYSVLLPPEYNPHHRYPLIVALRPADWTTEKIIRWWAGTADTPGEAQKHGYIVIAPEYLPDDRQSYDSSAEAHNVVIESIRDARKRFQVDSDRVFLGGHGTGGDAAFDIGMSHPDLFAGVIPIAGLCGEYCKWYWSNAEHVAWYVVGGERDRDSLAHNSREIYRMMQDSFDIIYVEYINRGYESFHEEAGRIFDWMNFHRRVKDQQEVTAKILRPGDNRFYWVEVRELTRNVRSPVTAGSSRTPSPMNLEVKVTPGNTIYLSSGAGRYLLSLSSDVIDFDQKLTVKNRGRIEFNDFLRHDIAVMLDDFRLRADRQKLYWARLDI